MRRANGLKMATVVAALGLLAILSVAGRAVAATGAGTDITGFIATSGYWSVSGMPRTSGQRAGQPYLGIDVRNLSDAEIVPLHLHNTHGAEIVHIDHDGPAGKMGLHEHDVIVQMNGVAIEGEEQIRRMLRTLSPGAAVVLVVSRAGERITLTAEMADRNQVDRAAWEQHLIAPSPQAPPSALPSGDVAAQDTGQVAGPSVPPSRYGKGFLGTLLMSPSNTGAMLEIMGPQLARFFGVEGGGGLLVRSVMDDSPAAHAGVRAGDIVLRANNCTMATISDWNKQIRKSKGRPVPVLVMRGHEQKILMLTPGSKHHSSLDLPDESVDAVYWAWNHLSSF
jgi:serine protease Do